VATALVAALIALVQYDIKKVLAYSTVSQLGFMFLGVGSYAFVSGFFHVFTHAFFKACLFLCAGSVIHAMHARIHDEDKSQDIRHMGGLRKYMPITFWTFAASTAAIIGLPLTSGFFSKDAILFHAYVNEPQHPLMERLTKLKNPPWMPPPWMGHLLYWLGIIAATMTAFYMCRLLFLTFYGDFRGWAIGKKRRSSAPPSSGSGHHDDTDTPGPAPQESPLRMTAPLIILATGAVAAGLLLNAEMFHAAPLMAMEHWLEPVFESSTLSALKPMSATGKAAELWLAAGGVAAFGLGSGFAYWVYILQGGKPAAAWVKQYAGVHKFLLAKMKVDELYEATVISAVDALADTSAAFDQWFVDGILAKATALVVSALGTVLRAVQTGVVHVYAAVMVLGIAGIGWFFLLPHPDATVAESPNGDYVVTAGPGLGYTYRWDADADGKPDLPDFTGDAMESKVHLDPGKSQVVKLEVKNAFGLTATKSFTLNRAALPTLLEVGQN
jgi:NADH-quinone oxidoreductase subunit L